MFIGWLNSRLIYVYNYFYSKCKQILDELDGVLHKAFFISHVLIGFPSHDAYFPVISGKPTTSSSMGQYLRWISVLLLQLLELTLPISLLPGVWCGVWVWWGDAVCLETKQIHWGPLWKVQQLEMNFGCFLQVLLDLYLLTGFTYLHLFYHDFTRRWQGCSLPIRWWDNESEKMPPHLWHIQATDHQKCHADYGKICFIRHHRYLTTFLKIYIIW